MRAKTCGAVGLVVVVLVLGALSVAAPGAALADDVVPLPQARDDSASTDQDAPVSFRVLNNDTGYYLRVTYVGTPKNGTVVCPENGTCTYTPKQGFHGADGFSYAVTDSAGQRSSAFVDVFTRKATVAEPTDPEADTTPPTCSLTVERSSGKTGRTVTLKLAAEDAGSGVESVRFANEDRRWTAWEPFDAEKTWRLTRGAGKKTVYAKFRDGAGNVSAATGRAVRVGG